MDKHVAKKPEKPESPKTDELTLKGPNLANPLLGFLILLVPLLVAVLTGLFYGAPVETPEAVKAPVQAEQAIEEKSLVPDSYPRRAPNRGSRSGG